MKRWVAGGLVLAMMLTVALGPGAAWAGGYQGGGKSYGGGYHGGGKYYAGGRYHGGGYYRHGGAYWAPGVFFGGLALGAALTAPFWYPPYPYYGGYYGGYYGPSYYYTPAPTVVYQQAPTTYAAPSPPAVQREVVYPGGKYVLYGDGVTQAWQWVWVPSAPANPPPPPQR